MKNKRKGFTLVELLVVIAILAVLATVSIIAYTSFTEKAKKSVDESLCAQYNTLLKAEQANDNDITLAEFIVYIEENGINSNQFKTSSKSYVFAYDKGNTTCVLLDAKTGDVAYPLNHKPVELWMPFPSNNMLTKQVYNYTLLAPYILTDANVFAAGNTYKLDLNKYVLDVRVKPACTLLDVSNGHYAKVASANNVTGTATEALAENVHVSKVDDQAIATLSNDLKAKYDNSGAELKLKDQFVSLESTKTVNLASSVPTGNTKPILFENLVLSNVLATVNNIDADITFRNCKFVNSSEAGYPLTIYNFKHNLTVENCEFVGTVRSINTSLPANGKQYKFLNNTFELNQIKTIKAERKDNAIQINAHNTLDATNFDKVNTKLVIEGNTVKKANSFIQVHANYCFIDKPLDLVHQKGTDAFNILKQIFQCNNNTVMNNIPLVQGDPGVQTDLTKVNATPEQIAQEQQQMDGYVAEILALIK